MSPAGNVKQQRFRIKLSTHDPYVLPSFPLARQTPGGLGLWDEFDFLINQPVEECDAWVVYDGLTAPETTRCPPENVLLVTAEPPAYKIYPTHWLRQFHQVISSHSGLPHPNVRRSQTALPWFVQRTYDQLDTPELPVKTKPLSIICSNKRNMKGHRLRLAFVRALQESALPIDFFGRGHNHLPDKWDGLAPYQFSIALENSVHPDYWTEKIGDCLLAGAVCIYYGCPNIHQYFPPSACEQIDIRHPAASVAKIRALLAEDSYSRRVPALLSARSLILKKYNLFALLADSCRTLDFWRPKQPVTIVPEPPLGDWKRRLYKWRRRYLG